MGTYCIQFYDLPDSIHWVRRSSPGRTNAAAEHCSGFLLWSKRLVAIFAGIRDEESPLCRLRGLEEILLRRILSSAGFPIRLRCDCCCPEGDQHDDDTITTSAIVNYSYHGHQQCLELPRIRDYSEFPFFEEGDDCLSCLANVNYSHFVSKRETKKGRLRMKALTKTSSWGTCDAGTSGWGSGSSLLTITEAAGGLTYDHCYGEESLSWEDLREYKHSVCSADGGSSKRLLLKKVEKKPGTRAYQVYGTDGKMYNIGTPCDVMEKTTISFDTALAFQFFQIIQRKLNSSVKQTTETYA
jgi:hypothetical protein